MGGKRKPARKRVKPRNPLVPVVRAKRPAIVPSKRAYVRRPKHPARDFEPDRSGER